MANSSGAFWGSGYVDANRQDTLYNWSDLYTHGSLSV